MKYHDWPSEFRRRVGKCIIFGLSKNQVDEAGQLMQLVTRHWRELVAGSQGYLTSKQQDERGQGNRAHFEAGPSVSQWE